MRSYVEREAFKAGYMAGHQAGMDAAFKLVSALGPEVRQRFMDRYSTDDAIRSVLAKNSRSVFMENS